MQNGLLDLENAVCTVIFISSYRFPVLNHLGKVASILTMKYSSDYTAGICLRSKEDFIQQYIKLDINLYENYKN